MQCEKWVGTLFVQTKSSKRSRTLTESMYVSKSSSHVSLHTQLGTQ